MPHGAAWQLVLTKGDAYRDPSSCAGKEGIGPSRKARKLLVRATGGVAVLREDLAFRPLDTCCRSFATMIRIASLLLGAALLCTQGAFARRVVSGESGQGSCSSSRKQEIWDSGAIWDTLH